jgi:hypothetical protein
VLEHIDNDFKALQEIQRILRPCGLAHIEVPANPPSFDLYDEVLMHFRRYRLGDLTTKAREAGFAILKATHLGFFVYPLFKMGKRRNQKAGKNVSFDEKKAILARQIGTTARNQLLSMAFKVERIFSRYPSASERCSDFRRLNEIESDFAMSHHVKMEVFSADNGSFSECFGVCCFRQIRYILRAC